MSLETQDLEFNILDEAVNEKPYAKPNISMSAEDLSRPLGEPSFSPPPPESDKPKEESKEDIRAKKNPEPFNPEMNYLSNKEKNIAAEQMADLIFVGYDKLHDLANKGLQVPFKKLNKMQNEGKINLNAMVQYDRGMEIPARDFFAEYNSQMEHFFKLDSSFIDDVKPPLVRILAKKGIGMTDENYVLFRLAEDMGTKAFMFIQQKRQIKEMLETIGTATVGKNAQPAPPPEPTNTTNTPTTSPEPPKEPEIIKRDESGFDQPNPSFQDAEIVSGNKNDEPLRPDLITLPKSNKEKKKPGRRPKNKIEKTEL